MAATSINRQEIQDAIAKAVELRALHAALMQGNSPSHLKLLSSPPLPRPRPRPRPASQLSAHDYPIFTPSYVDEPFPGYAHLQNVSQSSVPESWEENPINLPDQTLQLLEYTRPIASSSKDFPIRLVNKDNPICPEDDTKSVSSCCTTPTLILQNSPRTEIITSRRRNSLGDFKSVSSCNNCNPAIISAHHDNRSVNHSSNIGVPLTDSNVSVNPSQPKSRGTIISWLIPRMKRKQKNSNSSSARTESEEVSQVLKNFGTMPMELLKKELIEANQKKDIALAEVSKMRFSFGELRKKLETLESYCEELKKALKQAVQVNGGSKRGKNGNGLMPVSEDDMVEGFLQIVSEGRLSVKRFCKTLYDQIDETDEQLHENLNLLLKPYKLSLSSRNSKAVFYHLEAIINRAFYKDFENCVFQENGTSKLLDPQQHREAQFQSFSALRNISWNEALKKGSKYYSEEFSQFCEQKMRCINMKLNWSQPWSETLLHSFFVAAKCIWLLHLLAFSFNPALMILRVDENIPFDLHYMDDILIDKQKVQNLSRVKVMVMPGFYVQDKVLRCKVLCRYKSIA